MKLLALEVLVLSVFLGAFAQPQIHQHQKFHHVRKRTPSSLQPYPNALDLARPPLPRDVVCAGRNGTGSALLGLCSVSSTSNNISTASVTASQSDSTTHLTHDQKALSHTVTSTTVVIPSTTNTSTVPVNGDEAGAGLSVAFPDAQLDCSTFPAQYGPVALDYLGLGGWSGLQSVTSSGGAFTNIVTGVPGQSCSEGMMCSYACPPGYQKSQWPAMQGAAGQSVGGLQCLNGKLHLTNPSLSTSLCIPGMGGVQATNHAGGVVAICRTDYPGTESETIPIEIEPGQTQALANPNAATYYTWQGKSTSAQYYLNPVGTTAQEGCQWGSASVDVGNWAPINLGVGHSGGKTWLSIFQNKPTTTDLYPGTVEIQGDLSASCKYSNGQYCGATGCNSDGCTVSVNSGSATYIVSS